MIKQKNNVIIRSLKISDIETLADWWASGKVMAHAGFPNGIETDKLKIESDIIERSKTKFPKSEILMITLDPNQDIGELNYRITNSNIYEIGIKICELSLHGKGYGTTAIELLLDYLFNEYNAEKVILDTNLKNKGAQKFYERLGFEKIGVRENCWLNQLGVLQSVVDFEMTKENYYSL